MTARGTTSQASWFAGALALALGASGAALAQGCSSGSGTGASGTGGGALDGGADAEQNPDSDAPDVTAPPVESADDPPPAPLPCTKSVGIGSGNLPITQAALSLVPGDVLCIKAGEYDAFDISDITGTKAAPITIQNDGLVRFKSLSAMANLKHVIVTGSGAGASATQYGIYFQDVPYRAVHMNGAFDDMTLQFMDFTNVSDNMILFRNDTPLKYDGTDATVLRHDIRIRHVRGKNTNAFLSMGAGNDANGVTDVTQDLEVAYCTVSDSPTAGSSMWLGGAWGADIHHNRFLHVSGDLPQHTGIIALTGDGKVHHNYYRDLLGNGLRAWPVSLDKVGTLDVYNNIFLESQKYSAFEVQGFNEVINANSFTHPVNVRIFNNTAGNVNLGTHLPPNYELWIGAIVDSYGYFGCTVEITNNLGFNINKPQAETLEGHIVNYENDGKPVLKNNLYFATWSEAGLADETSGKLAKGSMAIGAGAAVSGLADDFYGRPRAATPDVGACEH